MEQKLIKIFQKAKYEADTNLSETVWRAITVRGRRITQFKLWVFALAGFASLIGLVPAIKILSSDLAQSGFYEYFSLIFSDSGLMLSYWKEFIFSLAESLPTMSIIFTLSSVFVFFLSLRYIMKQIIKNQLYPAGSLTLSI